MSMRSWRVTLILTSVFATPPCAAVTAATAATRAARPQTLLFDASAVSAHSAGPDANHVGHQQIASGVLRNSTGRTVGQFAFTCIWTRILAGSDAIERCSGFGRTADGRLEVAGPARESEAAHSWKITGETGAYRGAHGTLLVRDIGDREWLIAATIAARTAAVLRVAVITRRAVNAGFVAHADQICTRASRQLAALPPFPFPNFDPLHPDPRLLAQVGAFFTGPGDPRPIFQTLNTRLRALGKPRQQTAGGRGCCTPGAPSSR